MKNEFEIHGVQFRIVPYTPDKRSALYPFEKGCKYALYKVTETANIRYGLFETKHAAKKYALYGAY